MNDLAVHLILDNDATHTHTLKLNADASPSKPSADDGTHH
jgi:hypothetical protein